MSTSTPPSNLRSGPGPVRTSSASFGLLLATPTEALFQSAEGKKTPGSQTAHKSINLSQSKHRKEPHGYSRCVCVWRDSLGE